MVGIPRGLGPFVVGCMDFMCRSRLAPLTETCTAGSVTNDQSKDACETSTSSQEQLYVNQSTRGSFIRFFYPTMDRGGKHLALWFPSKLYAKGLIDFSNLTYYMTSFLSSVMYWLFGSARIPAYVDAPLLNIEEVQGMVEKGKLLKPLQKGKFPVVIFSHGRGGSRNVYSSICCDLASRGFIVAAVEHRDGSASATYTIENEQEKHMLYRKLLEGEDEFSLVNPQLQIRTEEIYLALDIVKSLASADTDNIELFENQLHSDFNLNNFKGKLDLDNIAIVGHSFGGATVVNSLAGSHIFKCGVCFDVWMYPMSKDRYQLVEGPIAFINSDTFHWRKNILALNELNSARPEADRPVVTILGTNHYTPADIPFVVPHRVLKWIGMDSRLDAHRGMELHREILWEFLRKHLDLGMGDGNPSLLIGGDRCPEEVLIGTNVDL